MDSFQEAFLQAGIVNGDDIKKVDHEEKKEEKKKEEKKKQIVNKKAKNKRKNSPRVYKNISKLDKEEYKVFNKMMQEHKRRKFLLHLVHAFLPNVEENHVDYIWSWNDVKGERRCVICNQFLISLGDAYVRAKKVIDDHFIRSSINIQENSCDLFENTNKKLDEIVQKFFPDPSEYITAFNNKVAGIYSANSKAFICAPCYKLLNNWVLYMILIGNRDVNYIVGNKINNPFYHK